MNGGQEASGQDVVLGAVFPVRSVPLLRDQGVVDFPDSDLIARRRLLRALLRAEWTEDAV